MSNIVIVAIPEADDPVWKISSEKIPHMTLLYLGESLQEPGKVAEFLEHATNTMMHPFYMSVDRRGVLGDDNADVLFFDTEWDYDGVCDFRKQLLNNDAINAAYNSVQQYDEFNPHLTLGYPTSPAKPTERRLYDVFFDRIALWVDDYDGPEFILKRLKYNMSEGVAMSDTSAFVEDFLTHHGVKGMKWGVRKDASGGRPIARTLASSRFGKASDTNAKRYQAKQTEKGKTLVLPGLPKKTAGPAVEPKGTSVVHPNVKKATTVKVEGGENHPATADAIKAAEAKRKLHVSGTAALSNVELQSLATRLNLEQQVVRLAPKPQTRTQKLVKTIASDPMKFINTVQRNTDTIKKLRGNTA